MKLRGNIGLLVEAAELIQYSRGPFGKMYTAEDVAGRILDAVDRALTGPSPSPPTCKQSLQVDPGTGGGATPCETCKGAREVLYVYARGPGDFPGNAMIPCPTCRPAPGADPWSPHDHEAKATAWGGGASGAPGDVAAPAAEPGKPATCPEACPSERDCYAVGRCILGAGRATPEKGGT